MLQLIDIQNGIDERQQVIALRHKVVQSVLQPFRGLAVLLSCLSHAQHHIQRHTIS